MPRPSSVNKNDVNFTVKLAPSQLKYLESLAGPLGRSSDQSVLREVLDQFHSWFHLPAYQREALQKDMASKRMHILQYIQDLFARRFEELRSERAPDVRTPAAKAPPKTAEETQPFAIRIAPVLLAYADELKPQLQKSSTADVIREIVGQLEGWFDIPRYQAERLHQEMAARRLHIIEYVQEVLARQYEALSDEARTQRGRRR